MKDLTKQIPLLCPTCGNDQFEYLNSEDSELEDSSVFRCSDCGFECTKAELIEMNQEIIENNIYEFAEDLIVEMKKEFR